MLERMAGHYVLYDVRSTDDLQRQLLPFAARDGVAFGTPRTFGPSRPAVPASGRPAAESCASSAPVPVWLWAGSAADLQRCARQVLNHLVYPLAVEQLPVCVAFPFSRDSLTARPLTVTQRSLLDLEDMLALLEANGPPALDAPAPSAAVLDGLDIDQRAAAMHGGGPARVLAAAGSGKTKTMVARIAMLVARGAPPDSVLVLAFNAEAALQLEERLAAAGVPTTRRIERNAGGVHCATFNAFGYRFQQQVLGGAPAVSAAGAAQERLLRQALSSGQATSVWDPYNARMTDAAGRLSQSLDRWRAELAVPPAADRAPIARYERLQADRGSQTFDDQVMATVRGLLGDPAHRRLLQGIYRFVLVDEFQDVNPAQQALLDLLSRPWRNLFVVGDDDQLIYGWRSAHVGSIIDFGADLPPAPHAAYYTLPTNYRCSCSVVERAEQLVLNNGRRAAKSMRARQTAPIGHVLFATADSLAQRCLEVAAFLATEHLRLGCPWSELAVLARYRAQLDALRAGLRRWSVPLGAPKPVATLDPAWAAQLDVRLQAGLRDERLRELPAALALQEILKTVRHAEAESALCTFDAARLLACDHATLGGFAAAWRRMSGVNGSGRSSTPWDARDRSTGENRPPRSPSGSSDSPDGVTLATIHSTKGREYASVAILDFAPPLEPLSPEEREEERRVLYVALTRAKHAVLLTLDAGGREPHPFMRELGRPPERAETRALRRELADLRRRLTTARLDLPSALAALLDEAPNAHPGKRLADKPQHPNPQHPHMGREAARLLELRGHLLERRHFAPQPAMLRWLRVLGS
jgi:DNA helicase-2/ATP-dependent DNA helicase PcrA